MCVNFHIYDNLPIVHDMNSLIHEEASTHYQFPTDILKHIIDISM